MQKEDFIKLISENTSGGNVVNPQPSSIQEKSSQQIPMQEKPLTNPPPPQQMSMEEIHPGLSSISPLQYEEVTLASKGLFYEESSFFSKGKVKMKYMTTQQEDILTSPSLIKKGIVFDVLLKSLLVLPPNTKYEELLIGDKNALLFALRVLNYGANYQCVITCPNCSTKNEKEVDLTQFKSIYLEDEEIAQLGGVERITRSTFRIYLEKSNKTAVIKLPTIEDENAISKEIQTVTGKIGGEVQTNVTTRLKRLVIELDGNKNKGMIFQGILALPFQDSQRLRKIIKKLNPDIDTSFPFTCSNCGHEEVMDLPIDTNFFWPEL